jgi:hypothetical protein
MGTLWINLFKVCRRISQPSSLPNVSKTFQETIRSKNCLDTLNILLHSTPTTQTELLGRTSETQPVYDVPIG